MIRTFASKALRKLYENDDRSGLPADQVERIRNRLATLDVARRAEDMNLPGYGFHSLSGRLKGFHADKVTGNWRIIFRFVDGDAFDVDHLDYH